MKTDQRGKGSGACKYKFEEQTAGSISQDHEFKIGEAINSAFRKNLVGSRRDRKNGMAETYARLHSEYMLAEDFPSLDGVKGCDDFVPFVTQLHENNHCHLQFRPGVPGFDQIVQRMNDCRERGRQNQRGRIVLRSVFRMVAANNPDPNALGGLAKELAKIEPSLAVSDDDLLKTLVIKIPADPAFGWRARLSTHTLLFWM